MQICEKMSHKRENIKIVCTFVARDWESPPFHSSQQSDQEDLGMLYAGLCKNSVHNVLMVA